MAILLVLAAIPGLGLVRFTTTHPLFCLSCHQNQEPTQLWLPSRIHPASVSCTDCHSSPGDLIPRKFSASDELMNQNCPRCHPTVPNGEQTNPQKVRIVKISHKLHADKKILCIDCHRNIEHDPLSPERTGPRWRPATTATRPIRGPRRAITAIRLTLFPGKNKRTLDFPASISTPPDRPGESPGLQNAPLLL